MSDAYAAGSIDGWRFNLGGPADDGVELILSGLEGWEAGDVDASIAKVSGYDGGLFGQPTLDPKVLTISGGIVAPSGLELERALDRLAVAFAHDRDVQFVLDEPLSRRVTGRRTSKLSIAREDAAAARWQVEFSCPDPRRYGPLRQVRVNMQTPPAGVAPTGLFPVPFATTGDVVIDNTGNADLPLHVTIVGPIARPVLRVGDRMTGWNLSLLAGQTLVVDTLEGTALLDGVANRRSSQYVDSRPLVLKPGAAAVVLTGDTYSPDAFALVDAADAYL